MPSEDAQVAVKTCGVLAAAGAARNGLRVRRTVPVRQLAT